MSRRTRTGSIPQVGSDAVGVRVGGGEAGTGMGMGSFSRGAPRRHMAIHEYAVGWNGPSTEPPPRVRLLLLSDVDLVSAGRIVEWAVQGGEVFDLCAVCGDFVPRPAGWSAADETEEQLSAEEGEMSATLAQLEHTVCRVVYVPGPLDPVMPSIRLSRSTRQKRGTAAVAGKRVGDAASRGEGAVEGAEGGLLQLTPTSKNLFRRNLRLAPGLSMAGFTEEPECLVGRRGSSSISSNSSSKGGGAGVKGTRYAHGDDQTLMTLRALCRSGGSSSRRRGRGRGSGSGDGAVKTPASPTSSSAPAEEGTSPAAAAAAAAAARGSTEGRAAPESVILLTRLGGAARPATASDNAGGSDTTARAPVAAATAAGGTSPGESEEVITAERLRYLWTQYSAAPMAVAGSAAAAATAAAAAATTREDNDPGRSEVEARGGGGGGEGEGSLLLHVCAGPGASLAVREALSEAIGVGEAGRGGGRSNASGGGGSSGSGSGIGGANSSGGDSSDAGIGGRIGGCTVAALGSLREHGAYCVVELDMPIRGTAGAAELDMPIRGTAGAAGEARAGGGDGPRWSVASLEFGRVEGFYAEREAARRRLAHGAPGNFVLNFD